MADFKKITGKGLDEHENIIDTEINFAIQDNNDVSGFGRPITKALCKKIISDYHALQKKITSLLSQLPDSEDLRSLAASLNENNQIVAGIYGRETILDILSQKGCEGIMYINCYFNGEDSIILLGVDQDGEPIGGVDQFKTNLKQEFDAVLYEVKGKGKKRKEILNMIGFSERQNIEQEGTKQFNDLKQNLL